MNGPDARGHDRRPRWGRKLLVAGVAAFAVWQVAFEGELPDAAKILSASQPADPLGSESSIEEPAVEYSDKPRESEASESPTARADEPSEEPTKTSETKKTKAPKVPKAPTFEPTKEPSEPAEEPEPTTIPETSGTELVVASYNIMVEKAARELAGNKGPEYRTTKAMNLLRNRGVDIAGIQEGDKYNFPLIKKYMPEYETWPETWEGGNAGGGRPIIYKKDKFDKVVGDYLEIDRYCTKINLPYILLKSDDYGLILVLNFHPTNRPPTDNPCANGSDNDNGNAVRKQNSHEITAKLRELTKDYAEPVSILVTCDCNATDHVRTNNNKDGDYTEADLPEFIFAEDGLINTYALAEEREGDESSTAHDSLTRRTTGPNPATRTRLDNTYIRPAPGMKTIVYKWENVNGEEATEVSDHTPVISTVKIVRAE